MAGAFFLGKSQEKAFTNDVWDVEWLPKPVAVFWLKGEGGIRYTGRAIILAP